MTVIKSLSTRKARAETVLKSILHLWTCFEVRYKSCMNWSPTCSLEERLKRLLIPPKGELARIVNRELRKGEPELGLVPYLIDPERIALDIGANRGIWTHVMSRYACTVRAYEPNPKMFKILAAALPSNAKAYQVALSDRSGQMVLEIPRSKGGWSNQHASLNSYRNQGRIVGKLEVEIARLDDLDLPPTGFLKIDVEGHEAAVIRGAAGLIARDKPQMVVELEERHTGCPILDSVAEIEALGYETFFLQNGQLQRIKAFHPERDHLGVEDTPAYINNFIFLPC